MFWEGEGRTAKSREESDGKGDSCCTLESFSQLVSSTEMNGIISTVYGV